MVSSQCIAANFASKIHSRPEIHVAFELKQGPLSSKSEKDNGKLWVYSEGRYKKM
jgi:hypothetical protein